LNYKRKRSRKRILSFFPSFFADALHLILDIFLLKKYDLFLYFLLSYSYGSSYHFKMIMLMMMAVAEGERSKMLLLFVKSSLPPPPPDVNDDLS